MNMATGYQKIFWGFFITTFHLTLGGIKIFPDFVGYIVIIIGLSSLLQELDYAEFRYAKTLVFMQILFSLMSYIEEFDLFVTTRHTMLTIFWLLINALLILFVYYYILSGTIRYFKEIGDRPLGLEYIAKLRNLLGMTVFGQMVLMLAGTFHTEKGSLTAIVSVLISSIYFLSAMGKLHQTFKSREM